MGTRLLMPLLASLLAAAAPPLPPRFNNPNTPEGWIWQKVQAGKIADLNEKCQTRPPLGVRERDDDRWRADCRKLDPKLLRALLTRPDLADHAPHGVQIRGARINGNLELRDAHVKAAEVWLDASWIAGDVTLSDAKLDGLLSFDGTSVDGKFNAERSTIGNLTMERAVFGGPVDLRSARIEGQMSLRDASVADQQRFDAALLHVGAAGLLLDNVKFGGPVDLRYARVEGSTSLSEASVADRQTFDAEWLHVGAGGLYLRNARFGGPIYLADAHVEGSVVIDGARFAPQQMFHAARLHIGGDLGLRDVWFGGPVYLDDAQVEGAIDMEHANIADQQPFSAVMLHGVGGMFLQQVTFGGPVDLRDASIDSQIEMDDASFAAGMTFEAERLHIGADLFARRVRFAGPASFRLLKSDGAVDLRGARVHQLDLEGAAVKDDLVLGGRRNQAEQWLQWEDCDTEALCLNLRNTKVGNLQDDGRAWPPRINLEGFTYAHLGGIGGEQAQDMRNRPIGWWRGWLQRDPLYSAQPYAQLASVLETAGNREGAADIRFFGRDRERSELFRGCPAWLRKLVFVENGDDEIRTCAFVLGLGLTAQQALVGYGIGKYNFFALGWALGLVFVGTVILCVAPGVRGIRPTYAGIAKAPRGPRQRSALWCTGASLHQVLPLVTISQEFSDFFNDPKRERLHAWQQVAFGVLKLFGWALGLFVVAAFSGLIQH